MENNINFNTKNQKGNNSANISHITSLPSKKSEKKWWKNPKFIITMITMVVAIISIPWWPNLFQLFIEKKQLETEKTMQNNINFNTNNQIGDNNVNIGKQQRHLDSQNQEDFKTYLERDKKIDILFNNGDTEAFNYAIEIKNYLESNGYMVRAIAGVVTMPPITGLRIDKNTDGDIEIFEIKIGT